MNLRKEKRTDCYFYNEEIDMGAIVSTCYYENYPFGYCPCEGCNNFVDRSKTYGIMKEYVNSKQEDDDLPSA